MTTIAEKLALYQPGWTWFPAAKNSDYGRTIWEVETPAGYAPTVRFFSMREGERKITIYSFHQWAKKHNAMANRTKDL